MSWGLNLSAFKPLLNRRKRHFFQRCHLRPFPSAVRLFFPCYFENFDQRQKISIWTVSNISMWLENVPQICSRILEIASQRISNFKFFQVSMPPWPFQKDVFLLHHAIHDSVQPLPQFRSYIHCIFWWQPCLFVIFLFCQLKALSLVKQKGPLEKEDPNTVRKKLSPKAQEEIQKKAFEDSSKGMPIKHWSPENFLLKLVHTDLTGEIFCLGLSFTGKDLKV